MEFSWIQPLICFVIGITIIGFTFKRKISDVSGSLEWKEELYREHTTQFYNKVSIPKNLLIEIDFLRYPTDETSLLYNDLMIIVKQPMANLKNISNKDIKQLYGPSALEKITLYEENYYSFINKSYDYSVHLYESDRIQDAQIVLEYIIEKGCDNSKVYLFLKNIYKAQNDSKERIDKLKEHAIKNFSNPIFLNKLIKELYENN